MTRRRAARVRRASNLVSRYERWPGVKRHRYHAHAAGRPGLALLLARVLRRQALARG